MGECERRRKEGRKAEDYADHASKQASNQGEKQLGTPEFLSHLMTAINRHTYRMKEGEGRKPLQPLSETNMRRKKEARLLA